MNELELSVVLTVILVLVVICKTGYEKFGERYIDNSVEDYLRKHLYPVDVQDLSPKKDLLTKLP